ncbi:MAG: hypothetical protein HQ475_00400 [SAR202 cluster bacterium]|nr:hypothetical protein [SAR202 cluster bacterium]
MDYGHRVPFDVAEWPEFGDAAIRVLGSIELWDEIKSFIDIYIARDPHVGERVPGTSVWAWTIPINPYCTILYSIEIETFAPDGAPEGKIMLIDIQEA